MGKLTEVYITNKVTSKPIINKQFGINSLAEIKDGLVSLQVRSDYIIKNMVNSLKSYDKTDGDYKTLTDQYKTFTDISKSINAITKKL